MNYLFTSIFSVCIFLYTLSTITTPQKVIDTVNIKSSAEYSQELLSACGDLDVHNEKYILKKGALSEYIASDGFVKITSNSCGNVIKSQIAESQYSKNIIDDDAVSVNDTIYSEASLANRIRKDAYALYNMIYTT